MNIEKKQRGTVILTAVILAAIVVFSCLNAHLLIEPFEDLQAGDTDFSDFVEDVQSAYTSDPFWKNQFVNLNGLFMRLTGRRFDNNVYLMDNGMLNRPLRQIDVSPLANNVTMFNSYLEEKGIPFLYVQAPYKMDTEEELLQEYADIHASENIDNMLNALQEGGVRVHDLRPSISATPEMIERYFYNTDHHWNAEGALVAFGEIAEQIADTFPEEQFDLSYTDPEFWERHVLESWFLGSEGKRVGVYYGGEDDLIYYTPRFETEMSCAIPKHRQLYRGDFEGANIRSQYIEHKNYWEDNAYCVYIGGDYPLVQHRNYDAPNKLRVLLIKDSFMLPVQAYLSTVFQEIDVVDPRHLTQSNIAEYASAFNPDIVVMMVNPSVFAGKQYADFGVTQAADRDEKLAEPSVKLSKDVVEIKAQKSQYNRAALSYDLQYGRRYTLCFDDVEFLEGSSQGLSAYLYDPIAKRTICSEVFDIDYCRKTGKFEWTFDAPSKGQNQLQVLLYSGLAGNTNGIHIKYLNVTLIEE